MDTASFVVVCVICLGILAVFFLVRKKNKVSNTADLKAQSIPPPNVVVGPESFDKPNNVVPTQVPVYIVIPSESGPLYLVPGSEAGYELNVFKATKATWSAWQIDKHNIDLYPRWILSETGAGGVYEIADARYPAHKLGTQSSGIPVLVSDSPPGDTTTQWEILADSKQADPPQFFIKSMDNGGSSAVFLGGGDHSDLGVFLFSGDKTTQGFPLEANRCSFVIREKITR